LAIRPPTDRTITPASKRHPRLSPNNSNNKVSSKRTVIAFFSPAITQHHAPELPR